MNKLLLTVLWAMLLCGITLAYGDEQSSLQSGPKIPANDIAKIESLLELRYRLAKATPDGTDITAAGTVLVLQTDGLVMNKVYMNANKDLSSPVQNIYENGQMAQVGLLGTLSKINSFLSVLGNTAPQSQSFDRGARLWVIAMQAKADRAAFRLLSDPVNNMRYHAILTIPYGNATTVDEALAKVAEVLLTDPPFDAGSAQQAQAKPPPAVANAQQTPAAGQSSPEDELRRAAEAGDSNAMFQLGNVLAQRGENVEAVQWFRKSSEKGNIKATNALGYMYEEGRGIPQNYAEASNLYLQAMKKGNPDAMVNRAIMFARGEGMVKDSLQAYMHLLLAAAYASDQNTRASAVKLRDEVAAGLSKDQVARGQAMADEFAKQEIK